jgi:exopolysaccharide biosynthesis WecB/TagA/CpsF family protein
VVEAAARRLQARFPRHRVVGWHHGYAPPEDDATIVARIRAARASLLLVAMGNPRQEIWVDSHLQGTGAPLALCVGAYFDFEAGVVPRAPEWVRAARAEWLFRLAIEPGRLWRRYVVGNPVFLARVLRQRLRGERVSDDARPSVNLPSERGRRAPAT